MKKYSFSLEKLLELREFNEKQAEIDLGKAIAVREKIMLELEDVGKKRIHAAYSRTPQLSIHELLAIENFCNRMDIFKEELLEKNVKAELVIEEKREKYLLCAREKQVLLKLKEKQYASWHKKYQEAVDSSLDDIVNSRASRH